ncbi:MAG: hypothetical protein JW755_00650 [Candidatus Aminicenantes bacterium]|nr:hypothetical protein [Candidatus Aminicenantes bacterium]
MINVKEHFYEDDPSQGHPDGRTRLKDAYYFFVGNGLISAAVQVSPSGEGSPMGLLLMDPEKLGKKRESLSFDQKSGLEDTMVEILFDGDQKHSPLGCEIKAGWSEIESIPAVEVKWLTSGVEVIEKFFCPDLHSASLARRISIRLLMNKKNNHIRVRTGILGNKIEVELDLPEEAVKELYYIYDLDKEKGIVSLKNDPSIHIDLLASEYWQKKNWADFGDKLLNHYFFSSRNQLDSVFSRSGITDASIWQYNREWVRDHSMMVMGLLVSGHHEKARILLQRLINDFVSPEGDTVDSSERRHFDETELDQNGELLWALWNYMLWTNDRSLAEEKWSKIEKIAEFPLNDVFRHSPSGLLMNRRDYWERHRIHGIETGMELAHQFFVSIGLESAAAIASALGKIVQAERWKKEAERLKQAMLFDKKYGMVENNTLIKRRGPDGKVQEQIQPLPTANLPPGLPLTSPTDHFLNPDTSVVLPIAMNFISPDSKLAAETLASCEVLWEQDWEGGGHGRYHFTSEADSPGAWPIASLFLARAWAEAGDQDKVIRIMEWLNTIPGAVSGAWFEFYGNRLSPPYPQVGILPWTWAEMLLLLISHFIGLNLKENSILIKPFFPQGVDHMQGIILIRGKRVTLTLEKSSSSHKGQIQTDGLILKSSSQEIELAYPDKDINLHALF